MAAGGQLVEGGHKESAWGPDCKHPGAGEEGPGPHHRRRKAGEARATQGQVGPPCSSWDPSALDLSCLEPGPSPHGPRRLHSRPRARRPPAQPGSLGRRAAGGGGATTSPASAVLTDSAIFCADLGPTPTPSLARTPGHAHHTGRATGPCPRSPLAFDASGPPSEGGAWDTLRAAGIHPEAGGTAADASEAVGPAVVALSPELGC